MNTHAASAESGCEAEAHPAEDFSLVLGGPLYQMYLRTRLLRPQIDLVWRRVAVITLIAWLPLMFLTLLAGTAFGQAAIPFIKDLGAQVRLLLALPLLILAEPLVHHHVRSTARQFVERAIIGPHEKAAFRAIVADTVKLRGSVIAEIALLLASVSLGFWVWREEFALRIGAWYDVGDGPEPAFFKAAAGFWYAFVSLNLFRFILFRWYYRLFIWYIFLWRVSRLALRLNPLHPDRAGGLGFIGIGLHAFMPVLLAHTALVAGAIGNHILHEGMRLPMFQGEILGTLLVMMAVVLLPALFFSVALFRARLKGWTEYGMLSMRYVDQFHEKWMSGKTVNDEPLIGSGDIQSLADLANAHNVLQEMRAFPVGREIIISILVTIALPFLPLLLTMFPLQAIVGHLIEKLI